MYRKDLNTVTTSESGHTQSGGTPNKKYTSDEDQQLENAASIGTSLMLVNSHRALFIMYVWPSSVTCKLDNPALVLTACSLFGRIE